MQQPLLGEGHDKNAVGGSNTHAHNGSHQSGHAEGCVRNEEKQNDSGQRRRQCGDDYERGKPGLEVHHDEQVDQDDGKAQATDEADVGRLHRAVLAAYGHETAARKRFAIRIDNSAHFAPNRAKVAILHRRIDIDYAADVVVIDRGKFTGALNRSNIRKNLRPLLVRAADGNILQILSGLNVVLRSLRDQVVGNAVFRVEIKHGVDLEAAAERDQHAVGDVAFGKSALCSFGAIDRDVEFWIVGLLLDAQVCNSADVTQLSQHLVGNAAVVGNVGSVDLNVDRRRQTEVQRLGHDVSRREIKRHSGKFAREPLAQGPHVAGSRVVLFVQRHEHICVGLSSEPGVVVHVVDVADRQANV